MENNQQIIEHYNNRDEDGRLATKRGSVEFLTTMRYIEKYLKPTDRVIEIGAGTGRYSHALARMGYAVDAVELVPHHIEIFRQNTQPGENVTITQGNALNLSGFGDDCYDITLLLGPLYHLYNEKDKRQAISEAIRVTKPGGVIFAAYVITDAMILDIGFKQKRISIPEYIEKGYIHPETFVALGPAGMFELVRKEDIDHLMSSFSVTRLHYVGVDLFTCCIGEELDAMDDDTFALYLKYQFAVCERADLAGITPHSLDIFRKG
jgi:SAM-dependent methyltransferase